MLVLRRGKDQSVMIGDDIEVKVLEIIGTQVRLGFRAPKDVTVHRKEVWLEIADVGKSTHGMDPQ